MNYGLVFGSGERYLCIMDDVYYVEKGDIVKIVSSENEYYHYVYSDNTDKFLYKMSKSTTEFEIDYISLKENRINKLKELGL